MTEILELFLKLGPEFTISGILAIVVVFLFRIHREDSKSHKAEYKEIVGQMFDVVNKNTASHTKLSESIRDIKKG